MSKLHIVTTHVSSQDDYTVCEKVHSFLKFALWIETLLQRATETDLQSKSIMFEQHDFTGEMKDSSRQKGKICMSCTNIIIIFSFTKFPPFFPPFEVLAGFPFI